MTAPPRPTSRRRALGRLAGTTAAAAAVTVLPAAAAVERAAAASPREGDDQRQRGYTESEHVRRYYRLARF